MKFKKLTGRVLISSLIGFGLLAPVTSATAVGVRAEEGINVVIDFSTLSFKTNKSEYLAFSQPANAQPDIAGTSNFYVPNGATVRRANGTVETVSPCIAKEGSWYNIYFNNNTWAAASKFTVEVGDSLTIKAGTWTSPTGHSITFPKDLIADRTADGYSMGVANKVSYTFTKDDLGFGAATSTSTLYLTVPQDLTSLPFNGDWGVRLKAKNAVTYTPAGAAPEVIANTGVALIGGKLCFETGAGWNGVSFMRSAVNEGDKFEINGKYTTTVGETLYEFNIEFETEYKGGAWTIPMIETPAYNYSDSNIMSVTTQVAEDKSYYLMGVTVDSDDLFPIDSDWNAQSIMENGALITSADGTQKTMDIGFIKNAERKYSMLMMAKYWPARAHDWQVGDNIKINGTLTALNGRNKYTVNITNWDFTWDGRQFNANFNRAELIQKVTQEIQNLGEPSLDTEWVNKLNQAKSDTSRLTSVEVTQIDRLVLASLYQKDRAYRALVAESQGKTVHRTTLKDVTATTEGNIYDTGAIIHYSNEYIEYTPYGGSWTDYHNGSPYDVKISPLDGSAPTFVKSAMCNSSESLKYIVLIFISSWGPYNGYPFAAGDRVEVAPTGYTAETDTDFYLMEVPAIDMIWCGRVWRDYKDDGVAIQDVITKINSIGEVEYTSESKAKIDAAQAAYDALDKAAAGSLSDTLIETLDNAQAEYQRLSNAADAKAIVDLIKAIGTVEYTAACKARIDAARNAYNSASLEVQSLISAEDYKILTDAEDRYVTLGYQIEADAVAELINAIGTVEYTDACKAKIDAARSAYDALADEAKELIDDATYQKLLDAEARYDVLKAEDDFVKLVNTLNENSTLDQIYSVVTRALSMYKKIENKADVAEAYNKLLTYIEKYNQSIASVNTAHEEANEAAVNMVGLAVAAPALVAFLAYAISKKGLF